MIICEIKKCSIMKKNIDWFYTYKTTDTCQNLVICFLCYEKMSKTKISLHFCEYLRKALILQLTYN